MFIFHEAFNPDHAEVEELKERYRQGKVGDVEVKQKLSRAINDFLDPIREHRARFEMQSDLVNDILIQGVKKARLEAQKTMAWVHDAMGTKNYQFFETALQGSIYSPQKNLPHNGLAFV